MKNIKVEIGDVFLIPYQDKYAVCKVLWISKRTKNAFSFAIAAKSICVGQPETRLPYV